VEHKSLEVIEGQFRGTRKTLLLIEGQKAVGDENDATARAEGGSLSASIKGKGLCVTEYGYGKEANSLTSDSFNENWRVGLEGVLGQEL